MSKSRVWVFTVNGKDGADPKRPSLAIGCDRVVYYAYQLEKAPTTGTLHYQGCVRFGIPKSASQVKKALDDNTAFVKISVAWDEAREYCKKPDTRVEGPWEEGDPGEQGKRNDLVKLAEAVKRGDKLSTIAADYSAEWIKYHKGILSLRSELDAPVLREDLRVYLLVGDSGVGKSLFVNRCFPTHYPLSCAVHPWMCGYRGEDVVAIEDYGPDMMPIGIFKRVLDMYPIRVPIKGGMTAWNPRIIIITSNHEIDEWYYGPRISWRDKAALFRRIVRIEFDGPTDGSDRGYVARNIKRARDILIADGADIRVSEEEACRAPARAVREIWSQAEAEAPARGESVLSGRGGSLRRHQEEFLEQTRLSRTQTWVEQMTQM